MISPELVVPDPQAPVYAASHPGQKDNSYYLSLLYSVGQAYGFEIQTLWNQHQNSSISFCMDLRNQFGLKRNDHRRYAGVIPMLQRQYSDSSDLIKQKLEAYLIDQPCEVCQGKRLKPEALCAAGTVPDS